MSPVTVQLVVTPRYCRR